MIENTRSTTTPFASGSGPARLVGNKSKALNCSLQALQGSGARGAPYILRREPQLTPLPPTTIDCACHTQLVLTASVEPLCAPDTMSGAGDSVNSAINLDLAGALGMLALLWYHNTWEVLREHSWGRVIAGKAMERKPVSHP